MSIKNLQTKIGVNADGKFGKDTLIAAMKFYKLSPERAAHFFAQTSHETGDFSLFTENLNYSADGLKKIFDKYFTDSTAVLYQRNPEKIANKVYSNRMGNGDELSGDGYKYRGRGALQLTGKNNYIAFSKYIKDESVVNNPDLVSTKYAFESAMFFFEKNNLWVICDEGVNDNTIKKLTKKINGGYNGLDDRIEKTYKFYQLIKNI